MVHTMHTTKTLWYSVYLAYPSKMQTNICFEQKSICQENKETDNNTIYGEKTLLMGKEKSKQKKYNEIFGNTLRLNFDIMNIVSYIFKVKTFSHTRIMIIYYGDKIRQQSSLTGCTVLT